MNRIGLSCEALKTVLPRDIVTHIVKPYLFPVCTKCQQYIELENIESFNKERCEACLLQLCFNCDRRGTEADFHYHHFYAQTYCHFHFGFVNPHYIHLDGCLCKIRLSQKDVVADLQQRRQEYKAELALRKAEETKMKRYLSLSLLQLGAGGIAVGLAGIATGLAGGLVFDKITEMRGRKRSLESTTKEETNQEKRVKTS